MRNVRPSWVAVSKDDTSNGPKPASVGRNGTGPRGRTGTLAALFSARVDGASVPFLAVDAIAADDGASVLWTVTDKRSGAVVFSERVAQ